MTSPVISVQNVTKNYGNFRAVDNLSFEVHPGEIFAMLGPNGAGKSTTMRMILDIIKPDSGKIAVLGGQMTDAIKDKIGYLPEERGLYRGVKLMEMMTYLGRLKGMSRNDANLRAAELLKYLDLEAYSKKKVSELSKGMQQKIQFAVTVMHRPQLIIVDEPFSGLDPLNTRILMDLLMGLRKDGTTIVMSTHQMFQVEELCERLLMINKGKVALYGTLDEVRSRYASHAIEVEGKGDWASVPGISHAEVSENGRTAVLQLKEGTSSKDVLGALSQTPGIEIQKFALAVPRLNDIFIRVVEGGASA